MSRKLQLFSSLGLFLFAVGCGNPHIANEGSVRLLEAMTAAQQAQLSQVQSNGPNVSPLILKTKDQVELKENELILSGTNSHFANEFLILTNQSQDVLNLEIGLEKGEVFSRDFNGRQTKDFPQACNETLSAGKSCSLNINFASSKDGHFQDNLTINFRGTLFKDNQGTKKISLKADRITEIDELKILPELSLKAWVPAGLFERKSYVDFGSLKHKEEKIIKVRLKNNGKIDALINVDFKIGKNFQFTGISFPGISGTCLEGLKPHQGCWLELEFAGQDAGLFSDDLIISFEDKNHLKKVTLTVNLLGERINQE